AAGRAGAGAVALRGRRARVGGPHREAAGVGARRVPACAAGGGGSGQARGVAGAEDPAPRGAPPGEAVRARAAGEDDRGVRGVRGAEGDEAGDGASVAGAAAGTQGGEGAQGEGGGVDPKVSSSVRSRSSLVRAPPGSPRPAIVTVGSAIRRIVF